MSTRTRIEHTPDGRRLCIAREVAASPDTAWELLTDTTRWPDWGPSVRAVDYDGRYIREGTTGRVRLPGGFWLPFEITECEAYRWTWNVARIPATGHRVEETAGGCRVVFELPLLAVAYVPVCRRALAHIASILDEEEETTIPVETEK